MNDNIKNTETDERDAFTILFGNGCTEEEEEKEVVKEVKKTDQLNVPGRYVPANSTYIIDADTDSIVYLSQVKLAGGQMRYSATFYVGAKTLRYWSMNYGTKNRIAEDIIEVLAKIKKK